MLKNLKKKALLKSLWVYHLATGSCNNCDIEILDCITPRFDIERFGMVLVGSPRHADVLLVTGVMTRQCVAAAKRAYEQTAKPCLVVAIGTCALGQGMFKESYNAPVPVDEVLPVDAYVPGCPPKPEAIIDAAVKVIQKLKSAK